MQIDFLLAEHQRQPVSAAIRRCELLQFHAKRITIKGGGAFYVGRGQHDMVDTLDHHIGPRFPVQGSWFLGPAQPSPNMTFRADIAIQ